MARGMPNTAMDGCSGFSPDHHTASISNIQLVCGPWPPGQSVQKGESTRRRSQQKSCSNPTNRVAAAVFPQQKTTGSVLADPSVFTSFKQFFWLTHPKLHTAFSGLTQWPTFVKCGASTHTAAVPSGILTRFSILLWCCYHIHKHLNGIFTCTVSIHEYNANVNRKSENHNIRHFTNCLQFSSCLLSKHIV